MEEKLFPVEKFQLINIERKINLESHHFVTTNVSVDWVQGLSVDAKMTAREWIFSPSQTITHRLLTNSMRKRCLYREKRGIPHLTKGSNRAWQRWTDTMCLLMWWSVFLKKKYWTQIQSWVNNRPNSHCGNFSKTTSMYSSKMSVKDNQKGRGKLN